MRTDGSAAFNGAMLRSRRRGLFRRSYEVSEDGVPVATLTGTRREGCTFHVEGAEYLVSRKGYRSFRLLGPAGEVASAERTSGRMWTVRSLTDELELVRASLWRESWELRRFGELVGTLRKDGAFKRTSTVDLSRDLPLPLRLFVLYVVETLWERSSAASAGAV